MKRLLVLLIFPAALHAFVSANPSPSHPWYDTLDRLEAYHCSKPTVRLIRPQSFLALREAVTFEESPTCAAPEWVLSDAGILFHNISGTNELSAWLLYNLDEPLSLRGLEATVRPLLRNYGGRRVVDGTNLTLEFQGAIQGGRSVSYSISMTPGWVGSIDNSSHLYGQFYLQEGHVKIGYSRMELTLGRNALGFGEARHGNLMFSDAMAPIDSLKFTIQPHVLGSPFSFLGPFTFETWLASQAESRFVDSPTLWAVLLGFRPSYHFEFSFFQLFEFGGVGAPTLEASDLAQMPFFVSSDSLDQKRRRTFGLSLGVWAPQRWVRLYSQILFDKLGRASGWFSDDMSFLGGIWFPRLGPFDARVEWVHTVPNAYAHSFWRQGWSYRGSPMGHPLGNDATGTYFDIGLPVVSLWRPSVMGFYERRLENPTGSLATEIRYGGGVEVKRRWDRYFLEAGAAYAQVNNHLYVSGINEGVYAVSSQLHYLF